MMSVNKSCDVISHQLFLHNEADKTTMILQRRAREREGERDGGCAAEGEEMKGGEGLNDEREREGEREKERAVKLKRRCGT